MSGKAELERAGAEELAGVISSLSPYVEGKIASLSVPGADDDDLRQEAFMAVFGALQSYRPDRDASFNTYARKCIDNRLADAVRRAWSLKSRPLNQASDIGEGEREPFSFEPTPEQTAEAREELDAVLERMRTRLSDLERETLIFSLQGYTVREIAAAKGVEPRTVTNALSRARSKLKKNS